jgi:hypothetical protein
MQKLIHVESVPAEGLLQLVQSVNGLCVQSCTPYLATSTYDDPVEMYLVVYTLSHV